jgi:hypothetical protein
MTHIMDRIQSAPVHVGAAPAGDSADEGADPRTP